MIQRTMLRGRARRGDGIGADPGTASASEVRRAEAHPAPASRTRATWPASVARSSAALVPASVPATAGRSAACADAAIEQPLPATLPTRRAPPGGTAR